MIDLLKIESAVTQMALRGASLEEIATHTKLKIQSIKKLLELSKKRLSPFSYVILKDPSFE